MEEKARQKALARKAVSLAAKNPETPASRTFAAKTDPRLVTPLRPIYIYLSDDTYRSDFD